MMTMIIIMIQPPNGWPEIEYNMATVMRAAGDFVDFNHGDRTKLYMRKVQNASVPRKYSG